MAFDLKEKSMLAYYKNILEQRLFDEYDILGFLIFIRRHLSDGKYPYIKEFADLVAHRKRNQGKILDAISGAIKNQYQLIPGTAHVQGYVGMQYVDWEKEWQELGHEFDI